MLLLSRFNAPALPVEPHIAAAAYYDRQQALNDEHEAQQKRAYANLARALETATPETWPKDRSIGRCRMSLDELLNDAVYQLEDKACMRAFYELLASPAAKELRDELATLYGDKCPEDFDDPQTVDNFGAEQ